MISSRFHRNVSRFDTLMFFQTFSTPCESRLNRGSISPETRFISNIQYTGDCQGRFVRRHHRETIVVNILKVCTLCHQLTAVCFLDYYRGKGKNK